MQRIVAGDSYPRLRHARAQQHGVTLDHRALP